MTGESEKACGLPAWPSEETHSDFNEKSPAGSEQGSDTILSTSPMASAEMFPLSQLLDSISQGVSLGAQVACSCPRLALSWEGQCRLSLDSSFPDFPSYNWSECPLRAASVSEGTAGNISPPTGSGNRGAPKALKAGEIVLLLETGGCLAVSKARVWPEGPVVPGLVLNLFCACFKTVPPAE